MHTQTRFRDLRIGDSFDFIDYSRVGYNSFFLTCTKTTARTYTDETGVKHRIGSINAMVFHVTRNAA